MLRKTLLPFVFVLLTYGFWLSPDFKAISAGVAIFLFGMLSLEEGFRVFSGGVLEQVLRRSTDRLWKSLSFGFLTTTLMQSSTLVSVISISFMSAGLLGLAEGIGIIFGANLGTTSGAWLMAGFGLKVNLSAYAMPLLVFGVVLLLQKASHLKGAGYLLAGIGFLFLGIHYMKEGFEAFKDSVDLAAYAVPGYRGLFIYAAIGILATVVMQSSHATLAVIITALSSGQVSYENALALAIGANVGTTLTALISGLGSNAQGRRLAGAHLLFNITTGGVAIALISPLVLAVDGVSQLLGIAADNYSLKLAVFHSLFNLLGVILMLPLIKQMVRLLNHLIKDAQDDIDQPKYIVAAAIQFPDTAVEAVRQETNRLYDRARDILISGLGMDQARVLGAVDRDLEKQLYAQHKVVRVDIDELYQRHVKGLFSAIIAFISEAAFSWKEQPQDRLRRMRDANTQIVEAVKACKHLQKNMLRYLVADNDYIRGEYNQLRMRIALLLRQLEQVRVDSPDENLLLGLDELRLTMLEWNQKQSLRYYQLIRDGHISPQMGSSLLNDSAYVNTIHSSLLAMAATLFTKIESKRHSVEQALSLDDAELKEILGAAEQTRTGGGCNRDEN
ncbi:MAG: phosphate:Na+ symporter [Motiliproteus sp.]|jgi:phosphate:Na+ symporter